MVLRNNFRNIVNIFAQTIVQSIYILSTIEMNNR